MALGLGLGSATSVLLAVYGFYLVTGGPTPSAPSLPTPQRERPPRVFFMHHVTEGLGRPFSAALLNQMGDKRRDAVRLRIEGAGRPSGLTVERYVARKTGEIILYGGLALVLLLTERTLLGLLFVGFCFFTDLDLYGAARKRRDEIETQLPDFLDVLAVTVTAGLSFRTALERSCVSMPGVLSEEFRLALRQMELGTSRREAFEGLRRRNKVEPLSQFVTAIQQAEELGAPLGTALVEISQDMRRSDAQFMRRKAQQLNPRITAITAATLIPALFILVAGALYVGSEVNFSALFG
ncbi:type II secretion system F family protein [Spiractinospora alimapuensis]|nr:type II secretion system F family protein [Spiractinospora alimapuensis]QVQ54776.1 type II secretion system F family protein [Spiractinospora alimapuensis]